jgi:hypothetical protein
MHGDRDSGNGQGKRTQPRTAIGQEVILLRACGLGYERCLGWRPLKWLDRPAVHCSSGNPGFNGRRENDSTWPDRRSLNWRNTSVLCATGLLPLVLPGKVTRGTIASSTQSKNPCFPREKQGFRKASTTYFRGFADCRSGGCGFDPRRPRLTQIKASQSFSIVRLSSFSAKSAHVTGTPMGRVGNRRSCP